MLPFIAFLTACLPLKWDLCGAWEIFCSDFELVVSSILTLVCLLWAICLYTTLLYWHFLSFVCHVSAALSAALLSVRHSFQCHVIVAVCRGHTRYSTHGSSDEAHCQPFIKEMIHGWFAVAHNGQLVNASKLKNEVSWEILRFITTQNTRAPYCDTATDIFCWWENWILKIKTGCHFIKNFHIKGEVCSDFMSSPENICRVWNENVNKIAAFFTDMIFETDIWLWLAISLCYECIFAGSVIRLNFVQLKHWPYCINILAIL